MDISLRLKTIAKTVKYRTIADVGTDHGYIPAYLLIEKLVDYAVCADINSEPLNSAKKTMSEKGLTENVTFVLGAGLEKINKHSAESLIIAGMGGMTIIDILSENLQKAKTFKQIILQPQHDIEKVRRFLHSSGFFIVSEKMLYEKMKYYTIIDCKPRSDVQNIDCSNYADIDYLFGKYLLDNKNDVLKKFIIEKIAKTESILEKISKQNNKSEIVLVKEKEHENFLCLCKEALLRYDL